MKERSKILYIQHAGSLGGSSMSLLYMMQGMRELGHTCVVALARPSSALEKLYADAGLQTISWPGLALWDHSTVAPRPIWDPRTWQMLGNVFLGWQRTARRTLELAREIKPELIHLNSMPCVVSAYTLIQAKMPFVWHVREPPPDQGLRTKFIRSVMLRAPQLIFISDYDRQQWVGDAKGQVVSNFVDFTLFDRQRKGDDVRRQLGIAENVRVLLYVGGMGEVKGIFPLLEALAMVQSRRTDWVCVMPGSLYQPSHRLSSRIARLVLPVMGSGTVAQRVKQRIAELDIEDKLVMLPFTRDIAPYFAACDMLLFPSTHPHFARPVIEAASMGKPSICSNLGGVNELIVHNQTGLLAEPGSASMLADAILALLEDRRWAHELGENAYQMARERFDAQRNVRRIEQIYDTIWANPGSLEP